MTVTESGFYYGTTSNPSTKVFATGTGSPFSKALTGLSSNTTYYYKAYVVEGGEERTGAVVSFKTKAVATSVVSTSSASSVKATGATLAGSYSDASGTVSEVGFYWGTSSGNLDNELYANSGSGASGSFSKALTGLSENTTYYFKAYVLEYNESTQKYEYHYGSVQSFKTLSATATTNGYLDCYEVPDVSGILSGTGTSGNNSGRDDLWYRFYTNNSKRQIAVHTFTHPTSNRQVRNYTVLYDGDNYAPLWTAHAMHSSMWLDDGTGRTGSWTSDPAISLTQQTGLENASSVGYSRGHFVSSQERQSSTGQNAQTFYYSNQAPQWQNSFNDGVWSSMESAIVSNAPSGRDTLYVVTGVLYEGSVSTLPSGNGLSVRIPSHFYKCLMKCSFNASGVMTAASSIAYVMTNEAHSGHYYDSAYVTTVDAIEQRTGFDFFPKVPSSLQTAAESTATPLW